MTRISMRKPTEVCSCSVNKFIAVHAIIVLMTILLVACLKPVEKIEDSRAVRLIKFAVGNSQALLEFAGAVLPRVASQLSFRVGGKIIAGDVEIGNQVLRGQVRLQLN